MKSLNTEMVVGIVLAIGGGVWFAKAVPESFGKRKYGIVLGVLILVIGVSLMFKGGSNTMPAA